MPAVRHWLASVVVALVVVAGIGSAPIAQALTEEERAEAFIRDLSAEALKVVADETLDTASRRKRFAELLGQHFDMAWIGQFVLGKYWLRATPEQRTDYLSLFEDSIVLTYTSRFDEYAGQQVRVLGSKNVRSKFIFVKSQIFDPENTKAAVNVMWRALPIADSFKIVDVVIEGVSMSITQRNEYSAVIQRGGGKIKVLIDALRKSVDRLRARQG
ncbi:MAG: ABC transporter substrate-binding protein [Rhodospirillaceae bacterium]|jgi:phospholipid transport system substrate-binding protein|nr:ABC transporter substrate-binding protein [Rhodospirillaceae bacterium]